MLIGLMRRLLSDQKGSVAAVVLLQLIQAAANLLLPTVNAAIIDDGIVPGDTGVISRLGVVMAGTADQLSLYIGLNQVPIFFLLFHVLFPFSYSLHSQLYFFFHTVLGISYRWLWALWIW